MKTKTKKRKQDQVSWLEMKFSFYLHTVDWPLLQRQKYRLLKLLERDNDPLHGLVYFIESIQDLAVEIAGRDKIIGKIGKKPKTKKRKQGRKVPADSKQADVVIEIHRGMVELKACRSGIRVEIRDYDTQGQDPNILERDGCVRRIYGDKAI